MSNLSHYLINNWSYSEIINQYLHQAKNDFATIAHADFSTHAFNQLLSEIGNKLNQYFNREKKLYKERNFENLSDDDIKKYSLDLESYFGQFLVLTKICCKYYDKLYERVLAYKEGKTISHNKNLFFIANSNECLVVKKLRSVLRIILDYPPKHTNLTSKESLFKRIKSQDFSSSLQSYEALHELAVALLEKLPQITSLKDLVILLGLEAEEYKATLQSLLVKRKSFSESNKILANKIAHNMG